MGKYRLPIHYLEKTVAAKGNQVAVVDGEFHLTFRELWERSLRLAHCLKANPSPSLIVISIPKSIPAVIAILAVQLAGGIYVPFDPDTPTRRRDRMLESLGPHAVLEFLEDGFRLDGRVLEIKEMPAPLDKVRAALLSDLQSRGSHEPLYIIFTSGTTGIPKGVTASNLSALDYIEWVISNYGIEGDEIIGSGVPFFFDGSVLDLYLCFAKGCTLHLIPRRCMRFPGDLVEYLLEHRVSLIFFVPSTLTPLATFDQLEGVELTHLRKVFFIGEPMPLNTVRYLRKHLPKAILSNQYGPAEATVTATSWTAGESLHGLSDTPIGLPCANTRLLIVDEKDRVLREPDAIGEIWIGGLGVALGYWNNTAETASRFPQNPEHNLYRDIFYRTGDLGFRSSKDGFYYMVGRKDHQFKHLGHRVEPGEIESGILPLEGVSECCVLYDKDAQSIIAFLTGPAPPSLRDLRKRVMDTLPAYMIPHAVEILDRFPLTPNGKIDRSSIWRAYLKESNGGA